MFGIAVVPSVLLAIGMMFSPESPRWLFQVFHSLQISMFLITNLSKIDIVSL